MYTLHMNESYVEFLMQFGDIVPIFPYTQTIDKRLSVLVLPGGRDVALSRQPNAIPSLQAGAPDIGLEYFDNNILDKYIEYGTPILGICRGDQSLDVKFGGTLIQHSDHLPYSDPRTKVVETMIVNQKSLPFKCKSTYRINSLHHQYVAKNSESEMISIGISKEWENCEAIMHPTKPIFGLQYHPEEINCEFAHLVMNYLLTRKERNETNSITASNSRG